MSDDDSFAHRDGLHSARASAQGNECRECGRQVEVEVEVLTVKPTFAYVEFCKTHGLITISGADY
jgi:hypothetical protein